MPRSKPDKEDLQIRRKRQAEWREFRRNFLFTQKKLGEVLGISRRTVQQVEAGLVTPLAETLRRFIILRRRHEGNKVSDENPSNAG